MRLHETLGKDLENTNVDQLCPCSDCLEIDFNYKAWIWI